MYLQKNGRTKDKPSILDQIEAVLVDFFTTNNLGFESKEKENATKVLAVSGLLFNVLQADRKALSHNESSKFNTPIFQEYNMRSLQMKIRLSMPRGGS